MSSSKNHRFVVLDGLRGVAAIVVLVFHIVQQHSLHVLPFAGLAVDFFYLLSGFVVAFAYEQRLQNGQMQLAVFAQVRLIRLYPLIFLSTSIGIALGFLAAYQKGDVTYQQIILSGTLGLLLLPSYVFPQWSTAYPFNMASWSLTFELFVNAVYGVIAPRLSTLRLGILTLLSAIILVLVAKINHGISGGNNQNNFVFGFGRVMFPFFAGVLLFRLKLKQRPGPNIGIVLLIALAALLLMPAKSAEFIGLLYVVLIFPVIITIGASIEVESWVSRFCLIAGELSYPIYIMQGPLLRIGEEFLRHLHLGFFGICLFGAFEAGVVVLIATFVNEVFDKPVQQYFRRRIVVSSASSIPDRI